MSNFSQEQLNRYEMYRRSVFPKPTIRRVDLCFLSILAQLPEPPIRCRSSSRRRGRR